MEQTHLLSVIIYLSLLPVVTEEGRATVPKTIIWVMEVLEAADFPVLLPVAMGVKAEIQAVVSGKIMAVSGGVGEKMAAVALTQETAVLRLVREPAETVEKEEMMIAGREKME